MNGGRQGEKNRPVIFAAMNGAEGVKGKKHPRGRRSPVDPSDLASEKL
jgi:hypothetical protein